MLSCYEKCSHCRERCQENARLHSLMLNPRGGAHPLPNFRDSGELFPSPSKAFSVDGLLPSTYSRFRPTFATEHIVKATAIQDQLLDGLSLPPVQGTTIPGSPHQTKCGMFSNSLQPIRLQLRVEDSHQSMRRDWYRSSSSGYTGL